MMLCDLTAGSTEAKKRRRRGGRRGSGMKEENECARQGSYEQ